jgi:hypothetical protein
LLILLVDRLDIHRQLRVQNGHQFGPNFRAVDTPIHLGLAREGGVLAFRGGDPIAGARDFW